jgi:hypothetical protein
MNIVPIDDMNMTSLLYLKSDNRAVTSNKSYSFERNSETKKYKKHRVLRGEEYTTKSELIFPFLEDYQDRSIHFLLLRYRRAQQEQYKAGLGSQRM